MEKSAVACHRSGYGVRDFLEPGLDGLLNQTPKDRFNDVLPAGAAATMSSNSSELAMTAK
jgi:hypothetical protein